MDAFIHGHNPTFIPDNIVKGAVTGAVLGETAYWCLLVPMVIVAGGPITLGPAGWVFGAAALRWSASFSGAVFGGVGAVCGTVVGATMNAPPANRPHQH